MAALSGIGRRLHAAAARGIAGWRAPAARAWARPRVALVLRTAGLAAALAALGVIALALHRSRLAAPAPTLLVRDAGSRFVCEIPDPRSRPDDELGYWPVETLPPRLVAATLALEDRRFRVHPGVDPLAVARALAGNLRAGRRVSGASTIAMQVARMQDPGPRTYARKVVEATTAVFLTLRHGRDGVLAQYLRLAPYGNRIRGIGFAARRYLGKPVEDLSWAEIAFLAAIPQSPSRMNPYRPDGRERAIVRAQRILHELAGRGLLDAAELDLALRQVRAIRIPPRETRPDVALGLVPRLASSAAAAAPRTPLLETTLDLALEEEVTRVTRAHVTAEEPAGVRNAAVVVLERDPGDRSEAAGHEQPAWVVRAWVGSTGFGDAARKGGIDYALVPRSPGSTLKPFLYAQALEEGRILPSTVLDDLSRGRGGIENADQTYLGPLLPRQALANSRNVPAADLLNRIGIEEGYAFLRRAGLHDGVEPASRFGLGLALGGMPTTLERLVEAYTALAGDGAVHDIVWIRGQRPPARRLVSPQVAAQVTTWLADPLARLPTFPRMGPTEYPFPVAVKTGTSSDYRDAWTVAWTPRYVVGVWMGDPDQRPMDHRSGYLTAARLARDVMLRLHGREGPERQGLADLAPPAPAGLVPARLCALSGARATAACEHVASEWFRPADLPRQDCAMHLTLTVDRRDGRVASARTPPAERQARTVAVLPARYAAWARARHLAEPAAGPARIASAYDNNPIQSDTHTAHIRVTSPQSGTHLALDPEAPPGLSTLALTAVVEPAAREVVWWVDGKRYRLAELPGSVRWPLARGEHVFQARLATGEASAPVRVRVD